MKKDNRIFRPELLSESEQQEMAKSINDFVEKQLSHDKEMQAKRDAERAEKIRNGEYIERNGKIYDARFWKLYTVEFTDNRTGATSAIDTIKAPANYTAEQYIQDCEENADAEWVEMLKGGEVTLTEVD